METTMKQAEEERMRNVSNVRQLYDEYRPLKDHVDLLRSTVGLEPLPSVVGPEEANKLAPQYVYFSITRGIY